MSTRRKRRKKSTCVACARRIRPQHPCVGLRDRQTSVELRYHGHSGCWAAMIAETARRLEAGKLYVLTYYHPLFCNASGPNCSAGCFRPAAGAAEVS